MTVKKKNNKEVIFMAKRGRPFSENPRTREFRMRLSDEEYDRLTKISKDMGMSRADAVRKLAEDREKMVK